MDDTNDLFEAGRTLLEAGRFQCAADAFQASLEEDPSQEETYVLLAMAFMRLGRSDLAEKVNAMRLYRPVPASSTSGDAARDDGARFSFLIAPPMHCGSRFMQRSLAIHPDLYVPNVYETDTAIDNGLEQKMLNRYRPVGSAVPGLRIGLVLHNHGGWNSPAGVEDPPEVAERLARVVDPGTFIQCVRHPLDYVVSIARHKPVESFRWKFTACGLAWLHGYDLLATRGEGEVPPSAESPRIPGIEDHLEEMFGFLCGNLRYFHNGGKFRKAIGGEGRVVDLSQFTPGKGGDGLAHLFRMVGARPDHDHPLYHVPLHSRAHLFMRENPISLEIAGVRVWMRLGYQGEALLEEMPGYEMTEIATVPMCERGLAAGLADHPLGLFMMNRHWLSLPIKIRNLLVGEGILARFLDRVVRPTYLANLEKIQEVCAPQFKRPIPREFRQRVWNEVGSDIGSFMKRHPDIADLWSDPEDAFTRD